MLATNNHGGSLINRIYPLDSNLADGKVLEKWLKS